MGAYTPNAKVWYPDENDSAKLDTLLATQAGSIEDGLEPRLAHQEIAVGLKAGIGSAVAIGGTQAVIPFAIGSANGEFNNGFNFNSGIATIQTAGMYLVSVSLAVNPNATYANTRSVVTWLYKNATIISYGETAMSSTFVTAAQCTAVMNCVPGDTISVQGSTGGGTTSGVTLNSAGYPTYLSIALVQALPM
jgi:hypothetical protein